MPKKILIVDDEEDVRDFLQALFHDNGFEAEVASDGEKGLHKIKEFFPDLITLDIIMPNQSGVGFYRKLKKSDVLKDIPVIVLSGVERYKEFLMKEYENIPSPRAFIEKPFDADKLLEKVNEILK